ncbi:MAG: pyruvoyl-dependent arginine decarboxylase [Marmoricola sp.]
MTSGPQDAATPEARLDITVRTKVGVGRTLLSAFDHALLQAGVGNLNLIPRSSVIPPPSTVTVGGDDVVGGHGDRLYCVEAVAYADHPGEVVSAGLGWVIHPTIGGLFVEHTGGNQESVEEQIHLSLADMAETRGIDFGPVHTAVASAHCVDRPVCALAIAAYAVADWRTP